MAILNSSISFSSSTLLSSNFNINASTATQIDDNADVQTVTIPADQSAVVYGPSLLLNSLRTVYFYAHNPDTNTSGLDVYIQSSTSVSASLIATLQPSDFMYIPLAANGNGLTVTVVNLNGADASKVNVLWGSRS